ncbi:hypothetical protein Tco_1036470 [Tanacetum coccineum]
MSASNQQSLVESGASDRPPILEKGNYIPWVSRFRRFLENKMEDGKWMWCSIEKGPYKSPMIPNPDDSTIPNDTYKYVDACPNAHKMWERIRRLMYGSEVTKKERHSRIMNEFDKFATKEGESLESIYERLTTLVNVMDRNDVRPIKDELCESLLQFEPHVKPSKAKRAAKNHGPVTLIAHSNAYSSQSHASPSYSHSPQPYYVTHFSSVVDYEEDYQRELQGDA